MECKDARAISSAGLDQEAGIDELKIAESHIAGCTSCQVWMEALHQVNRTLRVQQVEVTDLSDQIMAVWEKEQVPAPRLSLVRQGLAAMGVMSVAFSLPLLIGVGGPVTQVFGNNPTRELAGLGLTMAAAFLISAWDGKARGRLAVVATGIIVTLIASVADLIAGNVTIGYEFVHVPAIIGLVLLWKMARAEPPGEGSELGMGRFSLRQLRGAA